MRPFDYAQGDSLNSLIIVNLISRILLLGTTIIFATCN